MTARPLSQCLRYQWPGQFEDHVMPDPCGDCHLWLHAQVPYRLVWEREHGLIAPGVQIYRTCRNKRCVNPAHLAMAQPGQTVRAGLLVCLKERRVPVTHCKYGHEYTPENSYYLPSNPKARRCVTCSRAYTRAIRKARRAEARALKLIAK